MSSSRASAARAPGNATARGDASGIFLAGELIMLLSEVGKLVSLPSFPRRGGAKRRGGSCRLAPPRLLTQAPLLREEGRKKNSPLLFREGWHPKGEGVVMTVHHRTGCIRSRNASSAIFLPIS